MSGPELQDFAGPRGQLACFETEAELDAATPLETTCPTVLCWPLAWCKPRAALNRPGMGLTMVPH